MEEVWEFNKIIAERTENGHKQYLVDWCPTWEHADYLTTPESAIANLREDGDVSSSGIPTVGSELEERHKINIPVKPHHLFWKPTKVIHSKRPAQCHYCMKWFSRRDNYKRHLKEVHEKRQPIRCGLSTAGFPRVCHLNNHVCKNRLVNE